MVSDASTSGCGTWSPSRFSAPASELVKDQLETYEGGYVKVEPGSTRTSIPGVFAAGDLTDRIYRQAVTSAGMGCMAALDAEHWLAEHNAAGEPEPRAAAEASFTEFTLNT